MFAVFIVFFHSLRAAARKTQKINGRFHGSVGPSLDVISVIHSQCDIPIRRKLEEAMDWTPTGIRRVPKPKVDLFLLKQQFQLRGSREGVISEVVVDLPVSEDKRYLYRVHPRFRYMWRRFQPIWGRPIWKLDPGEVQKYCCRTQHMEEWYLVDHALGDPVYTTLTIMETHFWLIDIRGTIHIRERFLSGERNGFLSDIARYDGTLEKFDTRWVKEWHPSMIIE